jgi:hypothetical protein
MMTAGGGGLKKYERVMVEENQEEGGMTDSVGAHSSGDDIR